MANGLRCSSEPELGAKIEVLQETAPIHRIRSRKKKGEWISVEPKSTMTPKGGGRRFPRIDQGTGRIIPPVYQYVHRTRRLGAVIEDRDDSPSTAGPLRRPLPRTRVRQGLDRGVNGRCSGCLRAHPDPARAAAPKGGTFLVRCVPLYRSGQGETDRLCIPAGGGLRAQGLRQCHDGQLG